MKIADLVSMLTVNEPPVRFIAYDGSSFGSADAPITLENVFGRSLPARTRSLSAIATTATNRADRNASYGAHDGARDRGRLVLVRARA